MNYIDQLGKVVTLSGIPEKVVSLVPSQTELLYELGLAERVVGITKFCVHPPEWFRSKPRVGGTKTVDVEKLKRLAPDLIIANKEENLREQVEELQKTFPVWTSDVNNLEDAISMILSVGTITGTGEASCNLSSDIRTQFSTLADHGFRRLRTAYLIWKDPYMSAGGDTFIHDMLERAGLSNVFGASSRYPEINPETLREKKTEVVLLSSEPYPFKQKHLDAMQEQLPSARVLLVDGEMFSWYGSRLLKAPGYFLDLRKQLDL